MKKLTRKTLYKMQDDLGFVDRRKAGDPLTVDDYRSALDKACGNRVIAAMLLGLSEGTLRQYLTRNPELLVWLRNEHPVVGLVLAAEAIDPELVKAEFDAGNGSMASIARKLGHGRTSIKKFLDRNPELRSQWESLNAEI